MVNSGLKKANDSAGENAVRDDRASKRHLARNAALTTRIIDVWRHQKLFWPSRFMVY
jgi:hypothetical protein